MADLSYSEKAQLEQVLGMKSGYVLEFSNRTFHEFILDAVQKDIDDPRYNYGSCSKANRLRQFWKVEANHVVGLLTSRLMEVAATVHNVDIALVNDVRKIASRLLTSAPVPDLDAIAAIADDRTFEALAKSVRDSIENNSPATGLDRLHTFVVKYVTTICQKHAIKVERGKPLHSIFGEYVKRIRATGIIDSEMTDRILKSSISILDAFNHVRNEQSFAHNNPILNYDESLLIFNHVCATIRFINSVELQADASRNLVEQSSEQVCVADDIPF